MIEFLCPNEHKIRCPDDKAGLPARCPKCGVTFRIPDLEELSLGDSAAEDSDEQVPAAPAAPSQNQEPSEHPLEPAKHALEPTAGSPWASGPERQIEFLCPNGHHLHGPASLQGRAGECPECRSRFRIPVIDEPELAPEPLHEPELAGEAASLPQDGADLTSGLHSDHTAIGAVEPLDFLQLRDDPDHGANPLVGSALPDGLSSVTIAHPLATLFAELWAARDGGSRVEVHLQSGSVLTPDGFVRSHSMQDYAVLVTKDADGRSTATVTPWSSVSRIVICGLKEVPGEVVR